MTKVLFVVHGMGDNLPGWSKPVVDRLDAALAQYDAFDSEPQAFRKRVMVEELCYDPVFDKAIEPWGRDRARLEQWSRDHGIKLDHTLTRLGMGQLPHETASFIWETLLDPVLYRGSPLIRDRVREVVSRQFIDKWGAHRAQADSSADLEVSVLCHSQGTIVMSDVLAMIGEARMPEFVPYSADLVSLKCLMTLANVSRLGPPALIDIDSTKSCVRPFSAPKWKSKRTNYIERMLNVRHRYDPFCFLQRFAPSQDWGDDYQLIDDVAHVHQANTHGCTHYLAHPAVHIPLFRALLGDEVIDESEEQKALAEFPDTLPPHCETAVEALRVRLQALGAGGLDDLRGLDELITKGTEFFDAVKEAADACKDLVEGLADD